MVAVSLLIGIYSYFIFSLGLLGLLYKSYIVLLTTIYISISVYFSRKNLYKIILQYFNVLKKYPQIVKKRPFLSFLIILIALQAVVNFIGALGPELGFDALWYHLTLPKMYLDNHSIFYIPGGLFYYSLMPKLTEMLYIAGLSFGNEIVAKIIHFSFGILSAIALYRISRKFLSKSFSLLVLVLFYSNLVVDWISITAYIDLARTFFEIMALWGFLEWQQKKELKWLIESAVMLGLAISTKLLAIGSLLIFSALIVFYFLYNKKKIKDLFIGLFIYWFICLLIPLPWFVSSFIHTGNPFYPFFSNLYHINFDLSLLNPFKFLQDMWILFTNSPDRISSFYIIFLPIAFIIVKKMNLKLRIVALYSALALLVWYLTPQIGGGRFILPYLPVFSILSIWVIKEIRVIKAQHVIIGVIILLAQFSIIYRALANSKYIPVILGRESKAQFLSNHLNFSFGDFYDIDGYFANNIKPKDTVLLYGFHNLYYTNFPFIDSSYVKKSDIFNYIAVQGNNLPERFRIWNLVYYNPKTNVKLYSAGGIKWAY